MSFRISYETLIQFEQLEEQCNALQNKLDKEGIKGSIQLSEGVSIYIERCIRMKADLACIIDEKNGDTLLHKAAREGKIYLLKILQRYGGDLNLPNKTNETAYRIVSLLYPAKIKDLVNPDLIIKVVECIRDGDFNSFKNYIHSDHNLSEIKTKNLLSLVHMATLGGRQRFATFLCSEGYCDSSFRRDLKNRTPLHIAVKTGHVLNALELIKAGAEKTQKDLAGKSPFEYASNEFLRDYIQFIA